jgi:glycerophosphoryl diester phosphodiesterase
MAWITSELKPGWQSAIDGLNLVSIHLKHDKVTQGLVAEIHRMGLRLAVWTVNDPLKAEELLSWGVDAVITDALNLIQPDLEKSPRV